MPFSVFRQHQRKLLAIFAILAMFSFVLSDSLPSWVSGSSGARGNNPVIAKLKWKTIYASDLEPMRVQRGRANYFVSQALQKIAGPNARFAQIFGGTSTRELVDAIILEHEANELGLPATPDIANKWLRQQTRGSVNARFFQDIYRNSSLPGQVTDDQLLAEIANQIRIADVRRLPETAEVTPLDVFRAYRDQNEKVSAYAVPVRAEEFVAKVPDPTDAQVRELYEAGKNVLPNPTSPAPGFLVPQQVKFEMVTADVAALAAKVRPTLAAEELREAYKARTDEFPAPPGELPLSIFAGAPDLTPHDAFPDVKDRVSFVLSEERARDEVNSKFDAIKNDTMRAFEEKYYEDEGATAKSVKPRPGDLLREAAAKAGLAYESGRLVPSTAPDGFGPIKDARLGTTPSMDTPRFGELAFAPKTRLYDPLELADRDDRRYLAWKVEDVAARVPGLDEVRADVARAWKLGKARPLAAAEAKAIAESAEKAGGGEKIRGAAGTRPVIITEPRARFTPSLMIGGTIVQEARANEIPELPMAGDRLLDALFSLEPKTAASAPNRPEDVYYALTLREREKAELAKLYEFGLGGNMLGEVNQEAVLKRMNAWMKTLRDRAGLPPDWAPPAGEGRGEEELADSRN